MRKFLAKLFRFRLRTLLFAVTLVAVVIGWRAETLRRHKAAVQHFTGRQMCFGCDSSRSVLPSWCWNDSTLSLYHRYKSQVPSAVVEFCLFTPCYRYIKFDCSDFTNADFQKLPHMIELNGLELIDPTEEFNYAALSQIHSLHYLTIYAGQISPAQLRDLSKLQCLERLCLLSCKIDAKQVELLNACLPDTEVVCCEDDASREIALYLIGQRRDIDWSQKLDRANR